MFLYSMKYHIPFEYLFQEYSYLIDGEHHETREDKDIEYGIKFVKQYINISKEKTYGVKISGNLGYI